MKKHVKKYLLHLITLLLIMCLMACSKEKETEKETVNVKVETTEKETEEKKEEVVETEKEAETEEKELEVTIQIMNIDTNNIADVKLSREQVRAKNKDTLLSIINNANIDEENVKQAKEDLKNLEDISEKEKSIETLLMAKGFSDILVSISEDNVEVIINAESITSKEKEQIKDIVLKIVQE